MRKRLRAAVGTVVLTVAALAPVALGASPAQAAMLPCNTVTFTWHLQNGNDLFMPSLFPSWTPYNCEVVRGMKDTDTWGPVHQLQQSINLCYRKTWLVIDGEFGPNTQRAVREVQSQIGVGVDGRYGPQTRAAMKHQSSQEGYCYKITD